MPNIDWIREFRHKFNNTYVRLELDGQGRIYFIESIESLRANAAGIIQGATILGNVLVEINHAFRWYQHALTGDASRDITWDYPINPGIYCTVDTTVVYLEKTAARQWKIGATTENTYVGSLEPLSEKRAYPTIANPMILASLFHQVDTMNVYEGYNTLMNNQCLGVRLNSLLSLSATFFSKYPVMYYKTTPLGQLYNENEILLYPNMDFLKDVVLEFDSSVNFHV